MRVSSDELYLVAVITNYPANEANTRPMITTPPANENTPSASLAAFTFLLLCSIVQKVLPLPDRGSHML